MFLDSIIAASWHLPLCCSRESTGRVLKLLAMMHAEKGHDPFETQINC